MTVYRRRLSGMLSLSLSREVNTRGLKAALEALLAPGFTLRVTTDAQCGRLRIMLRQEHLSSVSPWFDAARAHDAWARFGDVQRWVIGAQNAMCEHPERFEP